MDGAVLDPPAAYGYLDDDDVLMAEEDEEDHQSVSDEAVDEKEEYPYLNPPAYGYPDDGERPPFVLMEPYAYFADRDNATTASCAMRDLGGTLKVTFCIAHPPLVSYMCVHATALDHTEFAVEPHIIATETDGGLVLLRLVIGTDPSDIMVHSEREYFMYDASVPSLQHLPHPDYQHQFNDHSVAIVRKCKKGSQVTSKEEHDCSNCDYVLAAQSRGFGYTKSSALIMYHSDTETWSNVPVVLYSYPKHRTYKTLTIGGDKGTVAWVDLWRKIMLCDVLDNRPTLHTLDLPPPISLTSYLGSGNPQSVRDIAVVGGFIKYVELQYRRLEGDMSSTFYTWKVAVWSINTVSYTSDDWHMDYLLNSTEMPESSLPKLRVDEGTAQPTLSTLNIGLPKLSLQDDGIVYLLAKIDYRDNTHIAWVLVVDMRNQTVQKVGEFNSMRTLGLQEGYCASRISKYLKGASGAKQNTRC
ncbi:uncharacterized protein [Lolium perenne]|uniref:uncharacterized protein isoform X1 n=1 Tax=Lolium perenne TaxID=4522 RepID=UPI0021F66532|nr:uncharacterized protein LOC127302676 isoform X1 [Lolium perenne]